MGSWGLGGGDVGKYWRVLKDGQKRENGLTLSAKGTLYGFLSEKIP